MFPLDPKTIERIAKIAVDRDGSNMRTGNEIAALLNRCAWPDEIYYDGSPRTDWLQEILEEHRNDSAAIERFICRLCDPIEIGDEATAAMFRTSLNETLKPEQLIVSNIGGRPVIGQVTAGESGPTYGPPADLASRLSYLIDDAITVQFLADRAEEAHRAEGSGAFTLAVIGIGSFVEGLLLAFLGQHDAEFQRGQIKIDGRRLDPNSPSLHGLIEAAHQHGWIQLDAKDFILKVRDYRNFIHPRLHLAKGAKFDHDSIMLCWGPVKAILNDLEQQCAQRDPSTTVV